MNDLAVVGIPLHEEAKPHSGALANAEVVKVKPDYKERKFVKFVKKGWLNLREQTVIDAWLERGSYAECARRCIAVTGRPMKWQTCKRWLSGKWQIANYVKEKMESKGFANLTKDEYLMILGRIAEGKEQSHDIRAWELFGKAKGWFTPESAVNVFAGGINFVQKDGSD